MIPTLVGTTIFALVGLLMVLDRDGLLKEGVIEDLIAEALIDHGGALAVGMALLERHPARCRDGAV